MAYRVQLTASAQADAQEYAAFIREAHASPDAARRWLNGLEKAIFDLRDQPTAFSVIPEARELGSEYRSFNYHSHRVVFLVDEADQMVTVHRVYHGARRPLTEREL